MSKYRSLIENILAQAGISVNGENPWDMKISDSKVFKQIWRDPSLATGETYMEKRWDSDQLDEMFYRLTRHIEPEKIYSLSTFISFLVKHYICNQQSPFRSQKVAKKHYDLGNDLYQAMLGETMAYTCGYWDKAETLDQAQQAKYDLVCRKVELQPGDKVLELGCGWGSFAKYAAEKYQVEVTAVNISKQQMAFAKDSCKGLPIKLFTTDYRNQKIYNPQAIQFDKVVSIGMCEHVGYRNYKRFIKIARQNLKEDGLFLMHTIGKNRSVNFADPWIRKYIFPSGMLPSVKQIAAASEECFVMEDLHNFGNDYDKTLMAWFNNFEQHWPALKEKYDDRFYRMWKYYLLTCAGAFRARSMQLWQYVFSPKGKFNGYRSIR